MWDLSIHSESEEAYRALIDPDSASISRSVQVNYIDALAIKARISRALIKDEERLVRTADHIQIMRCQREIEKLTLCNAKVDNYVNKLEWFMSVDEIWGDCRRRGIDPRHRIIQGGRILQTAIDEMIEFLSNPDPLQELDSVYD